MEYKNLPDLKGWATLKAVVEKSGVNGAAEALHIGQPAVTKRLRALERCYKAPLLRRAEGRLHLTEAGHKVYQLAVQTLDLHAVLNRQLENMARGETSMRLEVSMSIGEHLLPDYLFRFSELHPNFKVDSRLAYSRKIQANLNSGLTDLALVESLPDHPDIVVQKWMEDELWLVCSSRHSVAQMTKLPVEQLADLQYVLREKGSTPRDALDDALGNIGILELNVALEVGSTDTIIEILSRDKHVSFLPRYAVEQRVRNGDLVRIKVSGFRILRTLWIARHRDNLDHPVAEAFIATIRN